MSKTQEELARILGPRLKARREALGLSQERLAQKMAVSHMTIIRAEVHGKMPSWDTLDLLADALKTTVGYLLGFTDSPETDNPGKRIRHKSAA